MNLENELRRLLRAKAAAYAPSPQPRASVVRQGRNRAFRRMSVTLLVIAGAVVAGTTLATRLTPGQRAFAALEVRARANVGNDTPRSGGHNGAPAHEHAAPGAGAPITLAMLRRNIECMRKRGFDLPDPVATAKGWQVIVERSGPLPSESPDYNVRKRWAQAVFVDCRLIDATDDLVLGGRTRQQIDGLMKCTRVHGFVLPPPTETSPGEFEFDLTAASPRWGSQAWYQTVFITCGLWRQQQ